MKADGSVAVDPEVELTRLKLQKSFEGSVTLDGTEGEVIGIRPVCSASASWSGSIGVQYRTVVRQLVGTTLGVLRHLVGTTLAPAERDHLVGVFRGRCRRR